MDESLSLAQAVCGGNSGTMCFALLPQPHSSATHTAILQHRRLVEDKPVAILVCLCTVGSITSIPRSRVRELQNPEKDRPLAPHWRVSWHGYSYNFQGIFGKKIIPEIFSISCAMLCASGSATGRGSDRRDRQQAPGRYAATGGPACGDR